MSVTSNYFETSYPFELSDVDGAAIATSLSRMNDVHTWIDLGCGPILPIWAAFVRSARRVIGLDALEENVAFVKSQLEARRVLEPHRRALRFARDELGFGDVVEEEAARVLFDRIVEVSQWDVLQCCERWVGECDLVSQVGCFGCLQSFPQVRDALCNASRYLRPGGRFLSVTWVQKQYDGQRGWNGPVSAELTRESMIGMCIDAGLSISRADVLETRDPTYDSMLLLETIRR